jgi:hypothetical protein
MDGGIATNTHPKALGHLALHYRAGDGDLVVRLFRGLGLRVEDLGPARNGDRFFRVVIDPASEDGFFFVAAAAPAQLAFEAALQGGCDAAALKAYRRSRVTDPEAGFHIGVRYDSLEELEAAVLAVEAALRDEPRLQDRLSVTRFRARAGQDAEVDARMAASPALRPDDREAFGDRVVQVFVNTDVVAGGLLTLGQTFELDYVFPGRGEAYPPVKVYDS